MAIVKKKLPTATPADIDGMTLMRVRTENVKRIRIVELTLNEPLMFVGGANEQGKSSLLDSIGWCLRGKLEIQLDPVRHGAQTGTITCDFGDGLKVKLSVRRTIQRVGDDDWTDSVDVEIPGFVAPSRIEEFLRKISGEFAIDPMAFDRLKPPEKFEALQKLVTEFDFKAYEAKHKEKYDERTDIGRDQRREQSAADAIVVAKAAPCERIDEAALTEELRLAGEKNLDTERRRSTRETARRTADELRAKAARLPTAIADVRQDAEANRDRVIAEIELRIAGLRQDIDRVRSNCESEIASETARFEAEAADAIRGAEELEAQIEAAGELAATVDAAAITERLTEARASNKQLDEWESQRDSRAKHQAEADRLAKQYGELTEEIEQLDAAKQKAIEGAKLPVEGLGFADGYITLPAGDGSGPVPWEQAGTAVRTDASLALAMAMQPKLKVILIRDASLIGKTIRERIRQRAAEKGFRVLAEVVEEGDGTHVVIEDGLIKRSNSSGVVA